MSQSKQVLGILFNTLISKICSEKGSEYFFETVIGCDEEFLEYIKEREGIQGKVYIKALKQGTETEGIFDIVRLRNNTGVKQCIVFTNRSIKDIDSLKDVCEREIRVFVDSKVIGTLIDNQDYLIKEDTKYNKFKEFLEGLISCVSPSVPELLTYLERVEVFYKTKAKELKEGRLAWAANCSLYVFSMWSSASTEFLSKGKINRIYLASKPINIHKRISSIKQISMLEENSLSKNSNQKLVTTGFAQKKTGKKILTDMICNQTYGEAYERIYYEYVEPLVGKKKKEERVPPKTELDQEDDLEYIDKYMIALRYLCESEGKIDEELLERQEVNENEEQAEGSFTIPVVEGTRQEYQIQYNLDIMEKKNQEVEKKFRWKPEEDHADVRRKLYEQYFSGLETMCNDLNIPSENREDIKKRIRELRPAWIALKHTQKTPKCIQTYVKETDKVCAAFYGLVRYIMMMNTQMKQAVASSGLLENLINIDVAAKNETLYIPCYNPLLFFYLWQINNRNRDFFQYSNKGEKGVYDYQLRFLEELNRVIPNDVIWYDNKKYMYVRDNKKMRFPYYLRYKDIMSIASMETINLLQTLKYIEEFRVNNLYKNDIRICLIGDIYLESARLYIKRLGSFLRKQKLERILIEIVTKTSGSVKTMLEEILDIRQGEDRGIEIRIENLSGEAYSEIRLQDYIYRNDLVFLLDSSFMYYEPRYVTEKSNNIRNRIQYQTWEQEKKFLGIPEEKSMFLMTVIPDIINCFQNSRMETELMPGRWDRYSLNTKLIMDIFEALRSQKEEDKAVIFISSDERIDTKLDNDQYLKSVKEGKNGNKTLKIIEWGTNYKSANNTKEQKGGGYIEVKLSDILSTFSTAELLDEQMLELILRIYYEKFPEEITIQAVSSKFDNSNEEAVEQIQQVVQQYFIDIIKSDFWLNQMIGENLYQVLWNESGSLEELMFVYSLKRADKVNITYNSQIGEAEQPRRQRLLNRLKRRTLNNNILQLLDICDKEKINYNMAEQIDSCMKKGNYSINREDFIFMADSLERFDKDEGVSFAAENMREYVERKWGK